MLSKKRALEAERKRAAMLAKERDQLKLAQAAYNDSERMFREQVVNLQRENMDLKSAREKAEAAHAEMRRAIALLEVGCCGGDEDGLGHKSGCLVPEILKSDCGQPLLDELARLRKENEGLKRARQGLGA